MQDKRKPLTPPAAAMDALGVPRSRTQNTPAPCDPPCPDCEYDSLLASVRATYTRSAPHTGDLWVNSDATEYVKRLEDALYKIGAMNREPRPDGTYNYSRAAIIDIARDALEAN